MKPLHVAVYLVGLLSAAPATAQDAVTLQYKFAKGDKLPYHTRSEMKQVQSFGGMEVENKLDMEQWAVRTVESVEENGDVRLTSETRRLKVNATFGQAGDYAFDSDSDERDTSSLIGAAATPVFERLSGAIYQIVLRPNGRVKEVQGFKELLADVLQNNPLAAQFAGGGSDEAAVLETQRNFPVLAAKAIVPGDTWEDSYAIDLPMLGRFTGKETYRYVGPDAVGDRKTAKIATTSEMTVEFDIKMGMADVSGSISTTASSGTIQFDVESGRVLSIEGNLTLEGDLTVNAGGEMIPVHQKQTQKMTVKLLDKLPE